MIIEKTLKGMIANGDTTPVTLTMATGDVFNDCILLEYHTNNFEGDEIGFLTQEMKIDIFEEFNEFEDDFNFQPGENSIRAYWRVDDIVGVSFVKEQLSDDILNIKP